MHNSQDDIPETVNLPLTLDETINEEVTPDDPTNKTVDDLDADTFSNDDTQFPQIEGLNILIKSKLDSNIQNHRYETRKVLGSGGGGTVFEIHDHNLKRSVAGKFLAKEAINDEKKAKRFIREALITSRLDHPSILPIYDLEYADGLNFYYTMKQVDGEPLSDYVEHHIQKYTENEISEIVNIFIKIAETIAYAHSKGIVHRDIKPDNVMLGAYGEVRVVDWGIAIELKDQQKKGMSGTPMFMSPEQANRMPVDERSDIYAIGTTLFYTLTKRIPANTSHADAFWSDKKSGRIPELNKDEIVGIPPPIMAICYKCLEAQPDQRYQSASELVNDLKTFMLGGIIKAYNYSSWDVFKHWATQNKTTLEWLSLVAVIICISTLILYQQYQRQFADWGQPIYVESFDNNNWKDKWKIYDNSFSVKDGQLISQNSSNCYAFYKFPIDGGIRIEFTGTMLKGHSPGDLSIVYTPDLYNTNQLPNQFNIDKKDPLPLGRYYLQNGAQGNECSTIDTPGGQVDYKRLSLKQNTKYKITGIIDGRKIRLLIDDELICSYDMPQHVSSGYIGFYGFYSGKVFDNVAIYNRELPEINSIIKSGDLLLDNKLYDKAAQRFKKISDLHKDSDLGQEALYKYGLCKIKTENFDSAERIWDNVHADAYATEILYYKWRDLLLKKNYDKIIASMRNNFEKNNNKNMRELQVKWSNILNLAIKLSPAGFIKDMISIREDYFPQDQVFSQNSYDAYSLLGEANRIKDIFPQQKILNARAMLEMGDYNNAIKNYPNDRIIVADALLYSSQYQRIIDEFADINSNYFRALIATGQFEIAKEKYKHSDKHLASILLSQGKYSEVISRYPNKTWGEQAALLKIGAFDRYFELSKRKNQQRTNLAMHYQRYSNGEQGALLDMQSTIDTATAYMFSNRDLAFSFHFLNPIIKHLNGDPSALQSCLEDILQNKRFMLGQRLWFNAALLSGKVREQSYKKQPEQHLLLCDQYLYTAIKEDLFGDKKEALKYYSMFSELKPHQRHNEFTIQLFVKNRVQELNP